MTVKSPIRYVFDSEGNITEFSEFQAADFIAISDGGTGAITASAARTNLDVDSSTEVTTKAVNNGITFAIALG